MSQEPVILFKDAEICNGETPVIYGLDMEVNEGDFVYVSGKVGTGKTSLVRTIISENRLRTGTGKVCGFDLKSIKEKEIPMLRRHIGVVFQDFQLLMDRNVNDNLEFALKSTGWKEKSLISKKINAALADVGMETKLHKMPCQLSGGEQQRIAIARALLNSPQLILADEPTGNLDNETADGIMNLITAINREKGTAVVMITHNTSLFEKYPGRLFVCADEKCEERL